MLPVLTHRQMTEVDSATSDRFGIPSIQLMENAAGSVVEFISDCFQGALDGAKAVVFCGHGNNGGDGAAVARMLVERGTSVTVIAIDWHKAQEGDAKTNFDSVRTLASGGRLRLVEFGEVADLEKVRDSIREADILIDGIFGTGLSRPVSDSLATIFSSINDRDEITGKTISCVAIDIPSGLFADSASLTESHVSADYTVTFTAPKLANVMSPARRSNGNLLVSDIGSPHVLLKEQRPMTFVSDSTDARGWLSATHFSADSYKRRRGHVLCFTGSVGYEGAAVLSANSAMMSGVGLVTLVTPEPSRTPIASRVVPEVMVRGFDGTESSIETLHESLDIADALLIGCGIGVNQTNKDIVSGLLRGISCPVVIDADALSLLSPFELVGGSERKLILTPHEGEFRRLFGIDAGIGEERIANVRLLAAKHEIILVLKGESVLIGFPDGRVVINPTGNPALGKAGNGDNLAGVIAGFIAQSEVADASIEDAVTAAVYIAGLAGDIACERYGERTMLASDVRDALSDAFRQVEDETR
jgi:hydroxyethylthiazole kinase-like uncharacterized protein yjeF